MPDRCMSGTLCMRRRAMRDEMKRIAAQSIAKLRGALMALKLNERVDLLRQIGYCVHCGDSLDEWYCNCGNDD